MSKRFNLSIEDEMDAWVRKEAERMRRPLNTQIVILLELGRKVEESRKGRDEGPDAA